MVDVMFARSSNQCTWRINRDHCWGDIFRSCWLFFTALLFQFCSTLLTTQIPHLLLSGLHISFMLCNWLLSPAKVSAYKHLIMWNTLLKIYCWNAQLTLLSTFLRSEYHRKWNITVNTVQILQWKTRLSLTKCATYLCKQLLITWP